MLSHDLDNLAVFIARETEQGRKSLPARMLPGILAQLSAMTDTADLLERQIVPAAARALYGQDSGITELAAVRAARASRADIDAYLTGPGGAA